MRDFAIQVTHRPGELARVADALASKGVNIKSLAGLAVNHQVLLRIVADDVEAARDALRENNIRFEEAEVVAALLENRAGALADLAAKLGDAGVNLQAVYVLGIEGDLIELAIIADDPKKVKKLVE